MSADQSRQDGIQRESQPRLQQVQRWMQSVLMHRGGVAEGVDSPEAREQIDISLAELPSVIRPSAALSSADRLEIYVNAYHARLMECLDEEFAVTRWALGEELFAAVTFGYLQSYPSKSYTLNQLGARFPSYLAQSRLHAADPPEDAGPSWADFIVELATLERTLYEVYDGPGTEWCGTLDAERLAAVPADSWGELQLLAAPCLRLLACEHPVSAYWGARKDESEPAPPQPSPSWLAIARRDFVVERHELSHAQFAVLQAIAGGASLPQCLAAGAEAEPGEAIESQLSTWFAEWMSAGFFVDFALEDHAD
jgi:hypothetical protein